jgi:hypothetical protein
MSQKAVGYLHILRVLGNLASHPSGEQLGDVDVRVASFALACVIDEFVRKAQAHPRSGLIRVARVHFYDGRYYVVEFKK